MSTEEKPTKSIAFIALFSRGGDRNVRLALQDPKTPPALRAELERYLADPFLAAAVDQEQLLDKAEDERLAEVARADEAEARAKPFSGINGRAPSAYTSEVRRLVGEYPALRQDPKALWEARDKGIIPPQPYDSTAWGKAVSKARDWHAKRLPKAK